MQVKYREISVDFILLACSTMIFWKGLSAEPKPWTAAFLRFKTCLNKKRGVQEPLCFCTVTRVLKLHQLFETIQGTFKHVKSWVLRQHCCFCRYKFFHRGARICGSKQLEIRFRLSCKENCPLAQEFFSYSLLKCQGRNKPVSGFIKNCGFHGSGTLRTSAVSAPRQQFTDL